MNLALPKRAGFLSFEFEGWPLRVRCRAPRRAALHMASVVYQCPTTGQNVQAWFDDDTPADDSLTYVSLRCPACGRIHLVNRTGKMLGDDD